MLRASGLRKHLGGRRVLDQVDLSVRPGAITVLIGPSGAGKSTLLNVMAMLEPADVGSIEIDDMNYVFPLSGEVDPAPWPRLGVVFQQLHLWPHLPLRQNVLLPARNAGLDALVEFDRLAERLGLTGILDRFPNEVSVGQRQRVALVRALVLQPKYLLLDEITSAQDVEQTAAVLEVLSDARGRGVGVLIVTHLLGFARRAADHVVFLADGAVVEEGSAAILDSPGSPRLRKFLSVLDLAR